MPSLLTCSAARRPSPWSVPAATRLTTVSALKVGVLGARGKVGRVVCEAVGAAEDLELVAEIDEGDDLAPLVDPGAGAVVDSPPPGVVMDTLHFCIEHDIQGVAAPPGFDAARLDQLRGWLAAHTGTG